jgi:hypothetical protein
MEKAASVKIATKMKEAMGKIDEALDYMGENVEFSERAPLMKALGEIIAKMTDEIYSRLVKANPELQDVLFPGFSRTEIDNFLGMAQSQSDEGNS